MILVYRDMWRRNKFDVVLCVVISRMYSCEEIAFARDSSLIRCVPRTSGDRRVDIHMLRCSQPTNECISGLSNMFQMTGDGMCARIV